MFKRVLVISLVMFLLTATGLQSASVVSAAGNADKYVEKFKDNYPAYLKNDKKLADAFLINYNHSEAQALIARAIWYMENGYMVYGHSKYWDTGFIDCSNFVSLVYKDLGYSITSASKKYNQVGKKVAGVYSRKIEGSSKYELVGIKNLRPGDIFTFWAADSDGNGTHIGHVAIYMGEINGQPAIIQTVSERPTAIGITTSFKYWYGEHFLEARRVLDDDSQSPAKAWQASAPVIPAVYQLPPQKPVTMPETKFMSNKNTDRADTPVAKDILISPFKDISGHWAEENIKQLQINKSLSGYPDGTYRADNQISRAEFAVALVKSFKLSPVTGKIFSDTSAHWARDYIATAQGHGIVSGYNETSFGPDDPITREQMAVMIVKAAQLDTHSQINTAEVFSDSSQVSPWSRPAVLTAFKAHIISGCPDKTFRPQALASRGEAATVIVNALSKKD
ncbi:MAG: S-layer homology domain-containing protein [Syntrophomonadaceae bacterium]|jgi:cell wall-associated NlpC family hydrolase